VQATPEHGLKVNKEACLRLRVPTQKAGRSGTKVTKKTKGRATQGRRRTPLPMNKLKKEGNGALQPGTGMAAQIQQNPGGRMITKGMENRQTTQTEVLLKRRI